MLKFPSPAAGVTIEDLDSDLCLYRADINEVLVLNQSAADVVRLADGELTVPALVDVLAHAYSTSAEALSSDVDTVIEDLRSRGYLTEAATAAPLSEQ